MGMSLSRARFICYPDVNSRSRVQKFTDGDLAVSIRARLAHTRFQRQGASQDAGTLEPSLIHRKRSPFTSLSLCYTDLRPGEDYNMDYPWGLLMCRRLSWLPL